MVFDRNSYLHGPARTSSEALDPLAAFASPDALDPQLQRFLEEACASLCRWFGTANQRSPLPSLRLLPDAFPETEGLGAQRLLDDLQQVMDGAYQPSHPGALAHLDPPPNTASTTIFSLRNSHRVFRNWSANSVNGLRPASTSRWDREASLPVAAP